MDHCLKHLYQFESLIGILLLLDIWKLILYLITEAILAVNLLAPWIWWRYSQAGLNKPFLWAKVKLQQLTQWMISRKNGRFEFINWHMVRYCEKKKLFFTRSRPNRKNDNAYVEQKNNTHIRQLLGYGRFDTIEQVNAINDLYRNELRLFNNFFKPVMKIISKEKINNSVYRKKYDIAKTPYQRLIESGQLPTRQAEKLTALYKTLNPVQLKKVIIEKVKKIKKMQSLTK